MCVLLGATVRVDVEATPSSPTTRRTRPGGTSTSTAAPSTSPRAADGIDAITDVVLAGATITLTATDDGVHSNDTVLVDSGTLTVDAGDDVLHADARLAIEDATVDITASFEGLEANTLDIAGGSVTVRSSDDGINASGADPTLRISGGTTRIDAGGDGVDVNGSITMTGGTLLVDGPKANMNGALDYDGTFDISGGVVVATGSSGMAMAPGSSSAQRSLLGTFGTQQAGTLVHVVAADGTPIVTFAPSKAYQSLAVSTPAVADGLTYQVVLGGTAAGSADFGLYAAADHSGGSVALTTTTAEAVSRTMGPGGGPVPAEHPAVPFSPARRGPRAQCWWGSACGRPRPPAPGPASDSKALPSVCPPGPQPTSVERHPWHQQPCTPSRRPPRAGPAPAAVAALLAAQSWSSSPPAVSAAGR